MSFNYKKYLKILQYGFFLWISVLVVSFIFFPVKDSDAIYFETLITITLVSLTIVYFVFHFKGYSSSFVRNGLLVGVLWMLTNLFFDMFLFSWGPLKKSFLDYMKDIGLTYTVIPVITTGFGYLLNAMNKPKEETKVVEAEVAKEPNAETPVVTES